MPPLLVGWVIDALRGKPPAGSPRSPAPRDPLKMAIVLSGLAVVIFFFESFFQWCYQAGFMTLAQRVQHDLRMDVYNHIQSREIAFFEEHRLGEILAMLNDDVNQLERFMNTGFNELVQLVVLFGFAFAVMFPLSWQLSLVAVAPIPVILWGSLVYQRRVEPRYRSVREGVGGLASRLENNILRHSRHQELHRRGVRDRAGAPVSAEYQRANFDAIRLSAIYTPLIRMAIVVGFAGVLLSAAIGFSTARATSPSASWCCSR